MILLARSSSRRWTSVTFEPNRRQEGRLLDGGVTAADDGDVLVAEEEAVTGRTPADAVAGQRVLVGQAELAVARAHRQDHGLRPVRGAAAVGDDLDVAGQVDVGDVVGDQLGAELLGLLAQVVHQRRAHDAVGETGEVLDVGGGHQGATGGHRALEHEGLRGRRGRRRSRPCNRPDRTR